MTNFKEVLDKALQDPEVRAEWDRTQLAHDVSTWLLRYRIEHDLTQTELGELLGWRQPEVARFESGEREPSLATLRRLAERLGITVTVTIRPERGEVHFTESQRSRPRSGTGRYKGLTPDRNLRPRPRRGPVSRRETPTPVAVPA